MTQYPDFDDPSYAPVTSSHDEETDYDADDDDNDHDERPLVPSSHAITVATPLGRSPAFRPTWLATSQARLLASPSKRKPVPTPPTPSLDSVAGLVTSRTRSTSTSMSTGSHGPGSLVHHTGPNSPRLGTSSFHKPLLTNGGGEYGHNLFNRTQRPWQTSQARPAVTHVNQELNAGSIRHLTLFLRQMLHRVAVTNSQEWEPVLMGLLLRVTDRVQIDVRAGDWLDVRHYVKIKKISGGLPQESEFVAGVVCSKNLAHRKMPQVIRKPRILILLFPLEFKATQGTGGRFVSLESVLNHERTYLESVLNRVLMYLPTLILVEKSVSSMAQEILWQKGVPFAYRVKRSTLEQVARLTGAKLIHSLEELTGDIQLGRCGYMAIESFQHQFIPGIRKSYMYFHDCPEPLGCTLVLRGAHQDKLATIKMVLQFMVYVAYSLKLEIFLLRDLFALTPQVDPITSSPSDTSVQPAAEESSSPLDHRADLALEPYRTTLLSTSPGVQFPLPYLLVRMQQVETPYHRVRHDYLQFLLTCKQQTHLHIPSSLLIGDATVPSLTSQEEWSNDLRLFHQYENILNDYTSDIRAGELFIQQHPRQTVDPMYHQNLYVFSATHRKDDHHPCRSPEIHMVEYYQESDISLGQYLEEMCFNPEFSCPAPRNVCGLPMTEHIRRYIHNHGEVTVTVEACPTPSPGFQDTLLMWSECQVCHQHTPVVPMAEETWKFSFGKFLEILFYQTQLYCRADLCPHAINYHHVLKFGYRELVAQFHYTPVPLYEVSIPSMKLYINSQSNVHLKQKDVERLRECIARFWDSVAERLRGFDIWDLVAGDRVDYCRADLQELLKITEAERVYMLQFVNQVNENTHPADTLALNAVRTVIQEKVYDWNTRFEQFAREYILPERDLRKNAGRKLRHLFLGPSNNNTTAGATSFTTGGPGTMTNGPGSTPLVTPADGIVYKPTSHHPVGTVSVQGSPPSHPPPMLGADSQTLHRHLEQLSLQPLVNTRATGDGPSKEQLSSSAAVDPTCLPALSDVSDGEPPEEDSEVVLPTPQKVDEFLASLDSQAQKDLHWFPYPVNMDRIVYRTLSLEHMRQEMEEVRAMRYQDWVAGTQGGDNEWAPEYEGEEDSDHPLGYPSLRNLAGTPDVVANSIGGPGWGSRMYRQMSRESDTSRKPSMEDDFIVSASTSPCRTVSLGLSKPEEGLTYTKHGLASGLFARSPSPRTAVSQRLELRPKSRQGQVVDKPRGLGVSITTSSTVANASAGNKQVKTHRPSRIPKLSSSPALGHAGISPTIHLTALSSIIEDNVNANRNESTRTNGILPSRSLSVVGTTSALPPVPPGIVKGNPSDLTGYRLGKKNTSVKADATVPSTLSSDAKWRASMSRVAHRIQASLGRGGDSKQRLHRLFHSSNGKLMRKSTTDRRPRLDLFFTTNEAVHDDDDFDDDFQQNPPDGETSTRYTTDEVHSDLGESGSLFKASMERPQRASKRHSETDATVAHRALEAVAKEATAERAPLTRISPLSTVSRVLTSALPSRPRRTTMGMLPVKQPSVAINNLPNKHVGGGTASTSRVVGESTSIREEPRGHRSKSAAPLPIPVRTTSRNYQSLGSRHSTPPIAHQIQRTRVAGYEYPPGQLLPSKSGVASNALRGRSGTRRPPSRHSPGLGASPRHDSPGHHPSTGRKSSGYHGADTSRRSGAVSRSSIGLSEREGPRRNFQETEQRKTMKRTGKLPQLPTPSANQAGPRTYFGKDSRIRKALGRKNSKNEERLGKPRGASHTSRRVEKTAEGYEKDATGETEQSIPSFDEESATDPEQLLAALLSGDIFGLGEHFTTPAETWTGWAEHPSEEPSATEENFHRDTLVGGRKSRRRFAQPSAAHHLPGRITYITPDLNLDQDDSAGTYRPLVPMVSDVPGGLPAIQPDSVGIEGETSAVSDHAIDTGLPSTKIDRIPGIYDTTTDIEEGTSTFGQSPAVATPQEPSTGGPSIFPPPEPASILKAISNYLVPALTELLLPLDYPFSPSVHILPDSAVVIRDEEPTSIIAYTLSSRDFRMQFTSVAQPNLSPQRVDLWDPYGAPTSPRRNLRITTTTTTTTRPTPSTQTTTTPMTTSMPGGLGDPKDPVYVENGKLPIDTGLSGTHSSPVPPVADQFVSPSTTTVTPTDDSKRSPQAPSHRPSRHNSAPTSPTLGSMPREHTWQDLEQTLRASTSNHVRYEFNHGPTNFVCKIFFAEQFDALRRSCECELAYIESLSRCAKWHASGGKSGSAFLKTADNRFIVKELSKPEVDSFLQFASNYFEYLAEAIFHELPTVLAKIYGLYQISFKNPVTGKSLKLDVMIMENLFYERQFTKTFDLKGSTRNRLVADTGKAGEVLLDENFLQYLTQSPLYVREHSKELIQSSIWNDTLFLANHDIVDYSLLVAIDEEKHDLVVGIVDFIQTFTWDKRLENWVKETGFLGGGGKQPTIISPKQYKQRFRNAMGRYFTVVPDKFFNTAIPLHEDDDSVDEETPGPAKTSSP